MKPIGDGSGDGYGYGYGYGTVSPHRLRRYCALERQSTARRDKCHSGQIT